MIEREESKRSGTVKVTFTLPADEPEGPVAVVGDFNRWDPHAHPLIPEGELRRATVGLRRGGLYVFRYLDHAGQWFDDESADLLDHRGGVIRT
jgi:1,4-alpha-glucan branching enzyme